MLIIYKHLYKCIACIVIFSDRGLYIISCPYPHTLSTGQLKRMVLPDSLNNQYIRADKENSGSDKQYQNDNRELHSSSNLLMHSRSPKNSFSGSLLSSDYGNGKPDTLCQNQPIMESLLNIVDDNSKKCELQSVFCWPHSVEMPVYISLHNQQNYVPYYNTEHGETAQEYSETVKRDEYVMTSEDCAQYKALQPLLEGITSQPKTTENENSSEGGFDASTVFSSLYNATPAKASQVDELPPTIEAPQEAHHGDAGDAGDTAPSVAFEPAITVDSVPPDYDVEGKIPVYPRRYIRRTTRRSKKTPVKKKHSNWITANPGAERSAGAERSLRAHSSSTTYDANSPPQEETGSDPAGVCKYTSTHPGCSEVQAPLLLPNTFMFLNEYSVPMLEFRYRGTQIAVRSDIENSSFPESHQFLHSNCVYPGALKPRHEYTGSRWNYERECNSIAWRIVGLNPHIYGRKGIIQKAVTSFRNTSLDPKHRSRSARSFARMKTLEERANVELIIDQPDAKIEELEAEIAAGIEVEEYAHDQPGWSYDAYPALQQPVQSQTLSPPQHMQRPHQLQAPSMPPMLHALPMAHNIQGMQNIPGTPQLPPSGASQMVQVPQISQALQASHMLEVSGTSQISQTPHLSQTSDISEALHASQISQTPHLSRTSDISEALHASQMLQTLQMSHPSQVPQMLQAPETSPMTHADMLPQFRAPMLYTDDPWYEGN